MKNPILFAGLLLAAAGALAQTPVLVIEDPAGDDVGDGTLIYPRRSDFQPGDLDLRALRVFRDGGGWRFEASFANPIKDPAKVGSETGGNESLATFARHGFFAFNLDVYIDTDRVPGSGNTATLPGRGVRVDSAHAWEKALILTPRPELMRRMLQETLEQSSPGGTDVAASIDRSVLFATDVRVRGRNISFTVPASFLPTDSAPDNWSITAFVTTAKINIETGVRFGGAAGSALERLELGVAQPTAGRPLEAPGYRGDRAPPTAVVDLLEPTPGRQQALLAAGGALAGLTRETRVARAMPAPAPAAMPAAAAPTAAAASGGNWFSRALDGVSRLFGGGTGAAASTATAAPVAPAAPATMQSLLQPGGSAAATAMPAAPAAPAAAGAAPVAVPLPPRPTAATSAAAAAPTAPARALEPRRPRDAAFFEEQEYRLRTLKRLRESGLINEAEYEQKRREVLDLL